MNDASDIIQAVRGPLMLITLGGLVAADYAGIYSFWRTWPILIIMFGVLKLLERAAAKSPPPPPNYPSQYTTQYPGQYPGYSGSQPPSPPPAGGNVI